MPKPIPFMKVPQPRPGRPEYLGMSQPHRLGETWIEGESDYQRRARVRFPDGKLRVVRCGGVPDTFYSIPCHSHDGYLGAQATKWAPDGEYVFNPHTESQARYGTWREGAS